MDEERTEKDKHLWLSVTPPTGYAGPPSPSEGREMERPVAFQSGFPPPCGEGGPAKRVGGGGEPRRTC
jgi:hypothetical protein